MTSHREAIVEPAGQRVRVAVIDSGVNAGHPHIGAVAGGVSVAIDGSLHEGFSDRLGHGTAVMAAIQEKAPAKAHEIEYFAVRIFEGVLTTSAEALRGALDWCLESQMDVINLSLGTVNQAHAEMFAAAVGRALQAGAVLVGAREANGKPCYPGCLPGVFAVELDWDCPRSNYRLVGTDGRTVIQSSGYPRPAPGVPAERNLRGISFAVANACGFVVRACTVSGGRDLGPQRTLRIATHLAAGIRL
jgi:subtilisin family serine protease